MSRLRDTLRDVAVIAGFVGLLAVFVATLLHVQREENLSDAPRASEERASKPEMPLPADMAQSSPLTPPIQMTAAEPPRFDTADAQADAASPRNPAAVAVARRADDPLHAPLPAPIVESVRSSEEIAPAPSPTASSHIAVAKIEGDVQGLAPDGPIKEGDAIRIGKNSRALLNLYTGYALQLEESTSIEIASIDEAAGMIELRVANDGSVRIKELPRFGSRAELEIRDAAGRAIAQIGEQGAAHSEVDILVKLDSATKAHVAARKTGGAAIQMRIAGQPMALQSGASVLLARSGASAAAEVTGVTNILPAPKPFTRPHNRNRILFGFGKPIPFAWEAVPGATRYHLRVSRDEDQVQSVYDYFGADPTAEIPATEDTTYYARVTAVDRNGVEGFRSLLWVTEVSVRRGPTAPAVDTREALTRQAQ